MLKKPQNQILIFLTGSNGFNGYFDQKRALKSCIFLHKTHSQNDPFTLFFIKKKHFQNNICSSVKTLSCSGQIHIKDVFRLKNLYMKLFGKVLNPNPICFGSEKPQRISSPFITKKYDSNDFDNIGVKLGFWPHYNC